MQRLNAIISFVNNEFSVDVNGEEVYYNLVSMSKASEKLDSGELKQKDPAMRRKDAEAFAEILVPIIVTEQYTDRDENIEKIFERINSSGRKLSSHDIRQASSIGIFPDLVRRLSTYFRGDETQRDKFDIVDMPCISISTKGLNYGIDPRSTFWCRHDIMPINRYKESKDEEIIASAIALSLLGWDFKINYDSLNALYRDGSDLFNKVNEKIEKIGEGVIQNYTKDVVNWIENIFHSVNYNFSSWIFSKKNTLTKDVCFIALFCALFRLRMENYDIDDFKIIANELKAVSQNTFMQIVANSTNSVRCRVTELLYLKLKNLMKKNIYKKHTAMEEMVTNLLSLSDIESQMVEFKVGVSNFEEGTISRKTIDRIAKTLVAMANTSNDMNKTGYVILGIADNEEAYRDWNTSFKEQGLIYGRHHVVGITAEANRHFGGVQNYTETELKRVITRMKISDSLKNYVLENYCEINFNGKQLILLPSRKQKNISLFDGKCYVREGSNSVEKKEEKKHENVISSETLKGAKAVIKALRAAGLSDGAIVENVMNTMDLTESYVRSLMN